MSTLINHNITVDGRRTSMRLEPEIWSALQEICRRESCTVNEICTLLERQRGEASLTGALRVYVLAYFMVAATEPGHNKAGHGMLV